jgi:uncharacterized RDD family membrane protein YckC
MQIASSGMRVLGAVVDIIILFIVTSILGYATGMRPMGGEVGFDFQGPSAIPVFILGFAYFIVPEALWGGTPAKLMLGMRVVNEEDGGKIDWVKSILRNLLRIVDSLPALYLVGFILMVASPKNQRLGDRVAKTVVVRV